MKPRILVPPSGSKSARIVAIGEAPAYYEEIHRRPFSGPSGFMWDRWLKEAGLSRRDVRTENLVHYRAPYDNIEAFEVEYLIEWMRHLHDRLAELEDPYVLVPMGNYATFALIGKGKVKAKVRNAYEGTDLNATSAEKKAGIMKLRGSIYTYIDKRGRPIKVIPTIHPAAVLHARNFKLQKRIINDWKKIKRESYSKGIVRIKRDLVIYPEEWQVNALYGSLDGKSKLSIDIETSPPNKMTCVGFAPNPGYAVCLPLATKGDERRWLPWIRLLCESGVEKVLQNGLYDTYWLRRKYGIEVNNWVWDTLNMHHALDPTESHDLGFLTSIYTDMPYFKDEAKEAEASGKYASNLSSLYTYNDKDCVATHSIQAALEKRLRERGLLEFYLKHYATMSPVLLDVMCQGVRVDTIRQKAWCKELLAECVGLRDRLTVAAGEDLYGEKDFSNKKVQKFLYETLKLPKQMKMRKTTKGKFKSVSADEGAIRKLVVKFPHRIKNHGVDILLHREKKREANYLKGAWDKDGKIRCSYKLNTEAGRLASSKNPMGRGYNLQNIKRGPIRGTFLPDEGCVFVRVDLSQVEDRWVKMYTGQARMVELANRRPEVYDCHTDNASGIFGVSQERVTKMQRYLGKKAVHGSQRFMTGFKLAEEILKDTEGQMIKTPKQCQAMIDKYLNNNKEIRDVYFPYVRETLIRDKQLVNSWGRVWRVEYEEFNDDLFRRAYSYWPQSEAVDLLNQRGMVAGRRFIRKGNLRTRINLQVHDEVIASCPPEEAYDWAAFLVESLETPRELFGNRLVVPACIIVAMDWKDDTYEFKKMPTRGELDSAVREVMGG